MRAHLHDRWQVELDQRFALMRLKPKTVGEPDGVREILCTHCRVMSETVQRGCQLDQLGLNRGIMRRAAMLRLATDPGGG